MGLELSDHAKSWQVSWRQYYRGAWPISQRSDLEHPISRHQCYITTDQWMKVLGDTRYNNIHNIRKRKTYSSDKADRNSEAKKPNPKIEMKYFHTVDQPVVCVTEPISFVSTIFPIFHHCQNPDYLLITTFIFHWSRRSSAVVPPIKYENDSKNPKHLSSQNVNFP